MKPPSFRFHVFGSLLAVFLLDSCGFIKSSFQGREPPKPDVSIAFTATDPRCKCDGSMGAYVSNGRKRNIVAKYKTVKTLLSDGTTETNEPEVPVPAATSAPTLQFVGCTKGPADTDGSSCLYETTYKLLSSRSATPFNAKFQSELRSLGQNAIASASNCKAICKAGDEEHCMRLGSGAWKISVPLVELYERSTQKQATRITTEEVARAYGEDPEEEDDPCKRGDILLNSEGPGSVRNTGTDWCIISSLDKQPDGSPWSLKSLDTTGLSDLQIHLPPEYAGVVEQTKSGNDTTRILKSVEWNTSARIQFTGSGQGELQEQFGGSIVEMGLDGERMIVATENGCLSVPRK